mmetsp:Transcript_125716/g.367326  ORF Transcript_125716/g.367326 Transcript_125716/m.367326 type:complete len:626 (-) Transcript_125716:132-2009(-)
MLRSIGASAAYLFLCIEVHADTHSSKHPHILYILADDFGWANADWHRENSSEEKATPFMSELIRDGVELDRMYSFKFCSPSRSAIQSGRNPIHVNVQNLGPTYANRQDLVSGYAGIPTEMTGMGSVLKKAGYATHFVGKWDCGMATPGHTPKARGYDTSLLYFHHLNDYWDDQFYETSGSSRGGSTCHGYGGYDEWRPVDLWRSDATGFEGPASGLNNSLATCSIATPEFCFAGDDSPERAAQDCPAYPSLKEGQGKHAGRGPRGSPEECTYEDALFEGEALRHIRHHDTSVPMFMFWALHVVHAPLEVPKPFLDMYADIAKDDWRRQRYLAMTRYMDSAISNVTVLLKSKGMYNDTLIVFSSDNGGPIYRNGSAGASNWPLRGGKASNWEGGIRVNAFVSGGFLPPKARGRRLTGLAALWDWYGTFASLAGVSSLDHRASVAGLPPVDSVDLWPYIAGDVVASPRTSIPLGSSSCVNASVGCINEWGDAPSATVVQGLLLDERSLGGGLWKLLVGSIPMDGWQGPHYPNASTLGWAAQDSIHSCEKGCLFQLDADPTEHHNLAEAEPQRVQSMLASLRQHNATAFSPDRGQRDTNGACKAAMELYGGFWGPWLRSAEQPALISV